jgi:alkanesulfonate monooxygenase SsuD/methylene tetrahydromethanopterin reductase-like flavin-dependent oxidoreductase (luciferase family)
MGGFGAKRTPMLAARYASEFNLPFADLDTFTTALARVDAACQAIDRDPVTMHRSVALCVACGEDDTEVDRRAAAAGHDPAGLREYGLAGTPEQVVAKIETYRAAGAQRVYLQVLDLDDLDHLDLLGSAVLPEVSA